MKGQPGREGNGYTGFRSCQDAAASSAMLRARRIAIRDRNREAQVLLKPEEYIMYVRTMRDKLKKMGDGG